MTDRRPGCPGIRACRVTCGHRAIVDGWLHNWQAWEQRLEAEVPGMYPTEVAEWKEANPPVTFRDYLIFNRR